MQYSEIPLRYETATKYVIHQTDLNIVLAIRLLVCLVALFFSTIAAAETNTESSYVLGVGDEVLIRVHDESDLTMQSRLNDSNVISYPFLGEIRPVGMTISQLEKRITDGLRPDYLIDPQVSVTVVRYRDFYINGEVRNPGGYAYKPGLTVRKAASLAGGLTDRASTSKLYIVRERDPEQKQVRVELDAAIGPGDTLIIQEGLF